MQAHSDTTGKQNEGVILFVNKMTQMHPPGCLDNCVNLVWLRFVQVRICGPDHGSELSAYW